MKPSHAGVMDKHLTAPIPGVGVAYRGSDSHVYVRTADGPEHSTQCECRDSTEVVRCRVKVEGGRVCLTRLRVNNPCPNGGRHT